MNTILLVSSKVGFSAYPPGAWLNLATFGPKDKEEWSSSEVWLYLVPSTWVQPATEPPSKEGLTWSDREGDCFCRRGSSVEFAGSRYLNLFESTQCLHSNSHHFIFSCQCLIFNLRDLLWLWIQLTLEFSKLQCLIIGYKRWESLPGQSQKVSSSLIVTGDKYFKLWNCHIFSLMQFSMGSMWIHHKPFPN